MITAASFTYLIMGALFGLSAGVSPGPILTLVITETLKHNKREGFKIALAPLITDLPIILLTWYVFSKLSHFNLFLTLISFAGGIYFAYLGFSSLKIKGLNTETPEKAPASLKKGITANFLNPNPYIFWFTIGIPTAFRAREINLLTMIFYFLLFYTMLVGSKLIIAMLVDRSRVLFGNNAYRLVMTILGLVLIVFAGIFIYDGIEILKGNL